MFSGFALLLPALQQRFQRALSFLAHSPEAYYLLWYHVDPYGFQLDHTVDPFPLTLPAPAARALLFFLFQAV